VNIFPKSIRWRLQLWHAALLFGVLTGFGVTAYLLARTTQYNQVDDALRRRGPVLDAVLRSMPPPGFEDGRGPMAGPPDGPPPWAAGGLSAAGRIQDLFRGEDGFYCQIWWRDGTTVARSTNAPLQPPPTGVSVNQPLVRTVDGRREWVRRTPPGEILLTGVSVEREEAGLRRLAWGLAAAGAAVLAAGLAGGAWMTGRAMAPLRDISLTAREIAGGDLSRRIPVVDTDNELGQLAAVLNATFARLDAAFAQQGRFTADASHELRTPVTVLLAQTQSVLARERTPEEYRAALEVCRRAGDRMKRLIESLLELAKFDAGQAPMKADAIDLAAAAGEAAEMASSLAAAQGVKLLVEAHAAPCRGDVDRIVQVASNLLVNAVRFNRPAGEVRLTTGRAGLEVFLRVTDTGEGISAEDLARLFQRFFRADASRSRATGGNGLGLAICKSIAEAHGGRIEVKSRVGEGSEFTLWLPGA
jgi:two-component system, OmpR family, sensor kinase